MTQRRAIAAAFAAAATLIVTSLGCAKLPSYYTSLKFQVQSGPSIMDGAALVPAFYVTDRARLNSVTSAVSYTNARSPELRYGACKVDIPSNHTVGHDVVTERVLTAVGYSTPNPAHLHDDPLPFADAKAFYAALAVEAARHQGVLVLVHGYNSDFTGPITRVAEVGYDLGGGLVPVAFCWPSLGQAYKYTFDENNVPTAARQLAQFLEELSKNLPAGTPVHLLAHSMGARVTLQALTGLRTAQRLPDKWLKSLTFAAADVDADDFRHAVVDDGIASLAERTTLYVSQRDNALRASENIHGRDHPRAGQASEGVLVLPGIDTIDVSLNDVSALGHSYYGDNRSVIQDLYLLLTLNVGPEKRNLYQANAPNGAQYYLIRP